MNSRKGRQLVDKSRRISWELAINWCARHFQSTADSTDVDKNIGTCLQSHQIPPNYAPLSDTLASASEDPSCYLVSMSAQLFATPWTTARQAPLSMGFPRQEYWNGLPFPSLEKAKVEPMSDPAVEPTSPALTGRFFTSEPQGKPILGTPGAFK